jgi:hypothetical protein
MLEVFPCARRPSEVRLAEQKSNARCHGTVPHLATGKAIGSSKSPMQECHIMHCEPAVLPTWLLARSLAGTKEQRHTMPWNTISRTKVQYINTQVFYISKITSIPLKDNISVNLHPKHSVHTELVTILRTRTLFCFFIDNHNASNL